MGSWVARVSAKVAASTKTKRRMAASAPTGFSRQKRKRFSAVPCGWKLADASKEDPAVPMFMLT
jgi:hypothetical protein